MSFSRDRTIYSYNSCVKNFRDEGQFLGWLSGNGANHYSQSPTKASNNSLVVELN